jgi:Winged helix DNA-binding domain
VGLGTRLAAFTTKELSGLLSEPTVVRAPIMRATVHLADAADFVAFRPLSGPLMKAGRGPTTPGRSTGVDLDVLAARPAELLAERPLQALTRAAASGAYPNLTAALDTAEPALQEQR